MITNYIPIKSVLYDLSLTLDPTVWNESTMTEWAIKALRKTASSSILEDKISVANLQDHKFALPPDLKYINQIVYNSKSAVGETMTDEEFERRVERMYGISDTTDNLHLRSGLILNYANKEEWIPLKATTNSFMQAVHCTPIGVATECHGKECEFEYTVDTNMIVTSSLKAAIVVVSYKAYPKDLNNDTLMPDDEDLKEAIFHYLLYNHYLSNISNTEGGLQQQQFNVSQRDFHLRQFQVLKAKAAAKLNSPSIDQMENIKRNRDRLVPRTNQWKSMFGGLSNREKTKHA